MILKHLLFIILNVSFIYANGPLTHIEVSLRNLARLTAQPEYKKLLTLHRPSLEAGSFFPDFGYNCLSLGKQSEDAHWPTFYFYTLKYIKETYFNELNTFILEGYKSNTKMDKFNNLLAFLFGIVSHGTADIAWHSLDMKSMGFIQTFGKIDWNLDIGKAHTIADIGGEFVLARMQNTDHISMTWSTPYEDIINIYKMMGDTKLTLEQLKTCMGFGLTISQVLKLNGKRALGRADTNQSPFLLFEYENYFKGGLFSLVDNVTFCWQQLIDYIQILNSDQVNNKKGFCNTQFPKYENVDINNPEELSTSNIESVNINQHAGVNNDLISKYNFKGVDIIDDIFINQSLHSLKCKNIKEETNVIGDTQDIDFGYAIKVDSTVERIVVSAPQKFHSISQQRSILGSIYIYDYNLNLIKEIINPNDSFMNGGQFGNDINFIDINNDTINDIIISEPHYSKDNNNLYQGRLSIIDGKDYSFIKTINLPNILNNQSYSNFAQSTLVLDLNKDLQKDLIISSPYYSNNENELLGCICIYIFNQTLLDQPDYCLYADGKANNLMYGYNIETINYNNQTYLIVGIPGYNNNSGAIELLSLNEHGIINGKQIKIIGEAPIYHIGKHFIIHQNELYLTVTIKNNDPAAWLTNQIQKININQLFEDNKIITLKQNDNIILKTKDPGSRLGLKLKSVNDNLYINHPLAHWEAGQLYEYNKNNNLLNCIIGNERDRLGWDYNFITKDNELKIIVSSIHNVKDEKVMGKIQLIKTLGAYSSSIINYLNLFYLMLYLIFLTY